MDAEEMRRRSAAARAETEAKRKAKIEAEQQAKEARFAAEVEEARPKYLKPFIGKFRELVQAAADSISPVSTRFEVQLAKIKAEERGRGWVALEAAHVVAREWEARGFRVQVALDEVFRTEISYGGKSGHRSTEHDVWEGWRIRIVVDFS